MSFIECLIINSFSNNSAGGSKLGNVLKAKEDMQKSPEQLEQEKREIISSRLTKLGLEGKNKEDLIAQVGFILTHFSFLYTNNFINFFDRSHFNVLSNITRHD